MLGGEEAHNRAVLYDRAEVALNRALCIDTRLDRTQAQVIDATFLADWALSADKPAAARQYANHAWELADVHIQDIERDFIRAARVQGQAALVLDDFDIADERLHHTLTRTRTVNNVQEELPVLIALAELARRRADPVLARELLAQVWESAEHGPYPNVSFG